MKWNMIFNKIWDIGYILFLILVERWDIRLDNCECIEEGVYG